MGSFSEETMQEAVNLVLNGLSIRSVAEEKGLKFQTLGRYVQKQKKAGPDEKIMMKPNYAVNKVFSDAQEDELASYVITCSKMFYGLPIVEICKLAKELAQRNNLTYPKSWDENGRAGIDWYYGFMQRHPTLSLRTPEGCSLSRATSFNRNTCQQFFVNLKNVLSRYPEFADGTRIYNLDETCTSTVQKPPKVVAEKGISQVNTATSGERGTHVTTCCIISASGNSLPPVIIFPRVHFKEHMLAGAPTGSLGLANPTGWMNTELFVETMKHFITHSNSSKEHRTLLIYDNHESHLSIEVLNLAKDNGVIILTLPPHSSGKMQPLDVGVFSSFTGAYNAALCSWMLRHPGKNITIHEVASCVGLAHLKAMTPSNITSAFRKCGIYPYDDAVFTNDDFMSSEVTYRPDHQSTSAARPLVPSTSSSILVPPVDVSTSAARPLVPSTSSSILVSPVDVSTSAARPLVPSTSSSFLVSPVDVRSYPHANTAENKRRRKKGRSMIATDTPNMEEVRQKRIKAKSSQPKKKKILFPENSGSEEIDDPEVPEYTEFSDTPEDFEDLDLAKLENMNRDPVEGDYVLVEFKTGKKDKTVYFAGKVIANKDAESDIEVSFLRKKKAKTVHSNEMCHFFLPDVPDLSKVSMNEVRYILPPPKFLGSTKRQQSYLTFGIDFTGINIE